MEAGSMARLKTQLPAMQNRLSGNSQQEPADAERTTLVQSLAEYLKPSGIPPTPMHEIMQEAAQRAGWIAPDELKRGRVEKREAGKSSGRRRGGRAEMRRSLLQAAREKLQPKHRKNPYAIESINALLGAFRSLFHPGDHGVLVPIMLGVLSPTDREVLRKTKRDTVIADLKVLIKGNKQIAKE